MSKLGHLITIATILALLPIAALPVEDRASAQEQTGPIQLNQMKLFMIEGMALDPLTPATQEEYQAITIPNGFIKDGFRGWNLLPVGHVYWKDVGTWYSQPLRQQINLGGTLQVDIWCYNEGFSVTSDFIFDLYRDNEILLSIQLNGQRINADVDTRITGRGNFPAMNDTTVQPGSLLSLRIQARCNGGATLKFGSSTLDSGITFGSNALLIHDLHITQEAVVLEYKDAFMAPWVKLFTLVQVNKVELENKQLSSLINSYNMTREIYWQKANQPGTDYEVFATMGYSAAQNISYSKVLKIEQKKVDWKVKFESTLLKVIQVLIVLGLLLAGLILYSKSKKRTWARRFRSLPPEKSSLPLKERKKAWKDLRKEKRESRMRTRPRKAKETPEEQEGFRIFKKKDKTPPARKGAPLDELEL